MTRQEWLFVCLMEEAAEVAKAASKIVRFGLNDDYPGYGNNLVTFRLELNDFMAVVLKLEDDGALPCGISNCEQPLLDAKFEKLERMYQYAKKKGIVE